MIKDSMFMVDLLCERGSTLSKLAAVAKDLDADSEEYSIMLKYMSFVDEVTTASYKEALSEQHRNVSPFKPTTVQ